MKAIMSPDNNKRFSSLSRRGFTLVELLVCMACMAVLIAVTIPALSSLSASGSMNSAVSDISLVLEESRAYAMAHDNYVWVGFSEDDSAKKLMLGVVAGTTGRQSDLTLTSYFPLVKARSYSHFSLQTLSVNGMASNGADISTSSFTSFQQTVGGVSVKFSQILQFSPQGEAAIDPNGSLAHWIQIGLQPVLRSNDANVAVFQVASLTGQVQVFRP